MVVDENATFCNQHDEASEGVTTEQDHKSSELHVADSMPRKAKTGGVLCTPAVRNLAKQLGVNMEDVQGSGEEGRVLKEDVLNYAAKEGFLKEGPASFSASCTDQFLQKDQNIPNVSYTYEQDYEDRTITLRYCLS